MGGRGSALWKRLSQECGDLASGDEFGQHAILLRCGAMDSKSWKKSRFFMRFLKLVDCARDLRGS